MPTFELSDGSGTYQVEAPNEQSALDAFNQMNGGKAAAAPETQGSSLGGVAKSLGVGVAEGAIGLAGLPGDLYNLAFGENGKPSDYGSASFKKQIEAMTGEFYKPQGRAEQFANTAGQFLPAVIGGPETLAAKLATRVAIPAAASEAAGALTGDNPYAKAAGALVGAGGAAASARKFNEMVAAKRAAPALPTGEQLLELGSNQFNQARAMDLSVKSDFAKKTGQDMRAAVENYDPEQIKPVLNAINRVETLYQPEKRNLYNALNVDRAAVPVPMNEVELARKQLSSLRTSADPSIRSSAKAAQEAITKNQMLLTAADAVSGDAPLYAETMRNAVGNYGAGKRSAVVTGKQDLAELNAGTAGSGANEDNALRQAMKQLARPINNTNVPVAKKLGFNNAEVEAIKHAAMGTGIGNTARYLGKFAPTGIVSGAGTLGLGHLAGGPFGAVALPAAGYLAKKIGDMSTKSAVSTVDQLVRSRSPLAVQVVAQLPPRIVQQLPPKTQQALQALVLANPILANQPRQAIGQPAAQ